MRIILTWSTTKHSLEFDVINHTLADWFVKTSQRLGNQYAPGDQLIDQIQKKTSTEILIQQQIEYIGKVNQYLKKLRMPVIILPDNWYDQRQLNRLHKDWSQTRSRWPKLTELFYKLDPELYTAYQEMNCHIHLIEQSFNHSFRGIHHWRESNPLRNDFFDWHVCHLYIRYPGHGRFAFEKWTNLDIYDDMDRDDINWHNIDAFVGINLVRPYRFEPPHDFRVWCEHNDLVPHGETLPLGNLVDWEKNLAEARQTVTENAKIIDNTFSFAIKI